MDRTMERMSLEPLADCYSVARAFIQGQRETSKSQACRRWTLFFLLNPTVVTL